MSNNFKKRVNAQMVQNKENQKFNKKFCDNKSNKMKNIMAYVLAFMMLLWTVASVLGVVAFGRTNNSSNTVVANAASPDVEMGSLQYGTYYNGLYYPYVDTGYVDTYTSNGLTFTVDNGGSIFVDGVANSSFAFVVNSYSSNFWHEYVTNNYYHFTLGVSDIIPQERLVLHYTANGIERWHRFNTPLKWAPGYSFIDLYVEFEQGDSFDMLHTFPNLYTSNSFETLRSIPTDKREQYFTVPLDYFYFWGSSDGYALGYDDGYGDGYDDSFYVLSSSYFMGGSLYMRPYLVDNYESISFTSYTYEYIYEGIDCASAVNLAVETFTGNGQYNSALQMVFAFKRPVSMEIIMDQMSFSGWDGTTGFIRFYDQAYNPNALTFPSPRYSYMYTNGSISNITGVSNIGIYYFVLSIAVTDLSQDFIINFPYLQYDMIWDMGYDVGYDDGVSDGKLDNTFYNEGYRNGYSIGYDKGMLANDNNPYTFTKLFSALLDVPVRVFTSLFDFNVLGINLAQFFFSLLSVCFILVVIKLLI